MGDKLSVLSPEDNNTNLSIVDGQMKVAPRLPRGVKQKVDSNATNGNKHYQAQQSKLSVCDKSRYLTFSKDQATSHVKSLKEELAKLEPQSKQKQKQQTSNSSLRLQQLQQPICEAFIMTGQSMMKLSCDESDKKSKSIEKVIRSSHEMSFEDESLRVELATSGEKCSMQAKVESSRWKPAASVASASESIDTSQRNGDDINSNRGSRQRAALDSSPTTITKMQPAQHIDPQQSNHSETKTLVDPKPKSDHSSESISREVISGVEAESKRVEESQVKVCELNEIPTMSISSNSKSDREEKSKTVELDEKSATTNDRESARRLAKRIYNLSGFKRSDVSHHLAKNNPFSQLVAEEYLKLFDFRAIRLDGALRKFLSKVELNGETQERERLLAQFSDRYFECNKDKMPSAEAVQTLVCALVLLNTDLHNSKAKKNKKTRISLNAFIDGLNSSLLGQPASGEQTLTSYFPPNLLIDLYEAIKKRPLKCPDDKCDSHFEKLYGLSMSSKSNTLPSRRFAPGSNISASTLNATSRRHLKQELSRLDKDQTETCIEFKRGYLNRKRTNEAYGKPTSRGRRGWRRVCVTLHDLKLLMRLGIHDEQQPESGPKSVPFANSITQDLKNTVRVHHSFAKRSQNYTKREHVFHLKLADQSEFLLQANSEQDLNSWIDTINFASACLSSPALPSALSSSKRDQLHSVRPILPAMYTKLSYWEQLIDHEERLQRLKVELDEHLAETPDTKKASKRDKTFFIDKIAYLKHEIERYSVYVDLMRKKSNSPEAIILSKHPQINSLEPSEEMIKSLPSFVPPQSVASSQLQSVPNCES